MLVRVSKSDLLRSDLLFGLLGGMFKLLARNAHMLKPHSSN